MAGQQQTSLLNVDSREFESALQIAMARMQMQAESMMYATGVAVAESAKRFCPIDTGWLKSSIGCTLVQQGPTGPFVTVGVILDVPPPLGKEQAASSSKPSRGRVKRATPKEYGGYIEYGTSRMRPQPFLRPALAEVHDFEHSVPTITGGEM